MPRCHRWAKEVTYYSDKDYGILHDHMSAIARERDHAVRTIDALTKQLEELKDALQLAHEALRREMP